MADLSPPARGGDCDPPVGAASGSAPEPDRDRAQLVLVAALAIAVVLVAFVLLVNAAIFTENLATRDTDVGARDALDLRATVVDGIGGIVDRENAADYDDRTELEANVTAGIDEFERLQGRTALERGVDLRLNDSETALVEGERLAQNDSSRAFTSDGGLANWTLVENVSRARDFTATVDRADLNATTAADAERDAFAVVLENRSGASDDDDYRVYLYENGAGNVSVAVANVTESTPTEVCSVDAATATVDLSRGTLGGEDCAGLDWGNGLADNYDISYRNGDEAAGVYAVVVGSQGATVQGTINDLTGALADDQPYRVPAVYAVETRLVYVGPELEYRTDLRIAPGEPDD